jgi:hypothetical protein
VIPLRGKTSSFDLLDVDTRSQWATRLHGSGVVMLDCLRPVLDALGLSEDKEAGRFLVAFDELLDEADVSEAMVVHHMGHTNERSRGDSRILDWPDATWKLVREDPEEPISPRYFSAFGRDVEQPESLLQYDPQTRRLVLLGGSRKDTASSRLIEPLVDVLRASPDMSGRQIESVMVDAGYGRNATRAAVKQAIAQQIVHRVPGERGAYVHRINPFPPLSAPVRHSAPPVRRNTESECASAPIEAHGAHTHEEELPTAPPAHCPHGIESGQLPSALFGGLLLCPRCQTAAINNTDPEGQSLF